MASPTALVVPAIKRHTATVIVAHGLGDSGAGWIFLAENWRRLNKFPHVTFVFPSAPMIPITVNFNMKMPGWYDIVSFDTINRSEDEPGIMRSRAYLNGLIQEHVAKGIPTERIVLGGFSQGGAMALFTGLTYPKHKLGGVFGLSCYQLMPTKFDELRKEEGGNAQATTSVFMGHGDEDPLVKVDWGRKTADELKQRGWKDVTFKSYPGLVHSAEPREIDDLEKWLEQRIPDDSA